MAKTDLLISSYERYKNGMMGISSALLVFVGFWRTFEFSMDRSMPESRRFRAFGLVYLALGILIAMNFAMPIVVAAATLAVSVNGIASFVRRKPPPVRRWIIWSWIILDVLILISLLTFWF